MEPGHRREIEIDTYDGLRLLYDDLEYPIQQLRAYFADLPEETILRDQRAARIFVFFV
jgi:hypothetical protein